MCVHPRTHTQTNTHIHTLRQVVHCLWSPADVCWPHTHTFSIFLFTGGHTHTHGERAALARPHTRPRRPWAWTLPETEAAPQVAQPGSHLDGVPGLHHVASSSVQLWIREHQLQHPRGGASVSEGRRHSSAYLQQEGVLLVWDLQSRGAPHVQDGAAGDGQPRLGSLNHRQVSTVQRGDGDV